MLITLEKCNVCGTKFAYIGPHKYATVYNSTESVYINPQQICSIKEAKLVRHSSHHSTKGCYISLADKDSFYTPSSIHDIKMMIKGDKHESII